MDKKTLTLIGLAIVSGGVGLIGIKLLSMIRKLKIKRERKQLRRYVKRFTLTNSTALDFVDGMSNFEIRILFKIVQKTSKKLGEIELPASFTKKIESVMEG